MKCLGVCLCIFLVPYAQPQFWADLHQIWHVTSLYPTIGHNFSRMLKIPQPEDILGNWWRSIVAVIHVCTSFPRELSTGRIVCHKRMLIPSLSTASRVDSRKDVHGRWTSLKTYSLQVLSAARNVNQEDVPQEETSMPGAAAPGK